MSICDDQVFAGVFERMQPKVQRFLRSKGLDLAQSADLAQDAFIRLWNNCAAVTEDKALAYLFTVANNLIIDASRKVKTKIRYTSGLTIKTDTEDPEYLFRVKDFKIQLDDAIMTMTEGSREVFMMSRFSDMSYREIADTLGLSVKAVEKRMSLALRHLTDQGILRRKR